MSRHRHTVNHERYHRVPLLRALMRYIIELRKK